MTSNTLKLLYSKPASFLFTFFLLFFYGTLFCTTGFDITDTGYNLNNQWALINGWSEYSWGVVWLSDLIGGAWLYLTQSLGLYGAHLGWSLLLGLKGLLVCWLLNQYIYPFMALFVSVLTGIIMVPGRLKIIYYSNLSPLFLMLTGFLFIKLVNAKSKASIWLYIGVGLSMAASFHTRFPSIIALIFFPILSICLGFVFQKDQVRNLFKRNLLFILSSLFFSILLLLPIVISGNWSEYSQNFYELFGLIDGLPQQAEHTTSHLLMTYKSHFLWKFEYTCLFMLMVAAFIGIWKYLKDKLDSQKINYSLLILAIIYWSIYYWQIPGLENAFRVMVGVSITLMSFSYIAYILLRHKKNNTSYIQILSMITFLSIGYICFAGSNTGFLSLAEGFWLALPFSLLTFLGLNQQNDRGKVNKSLLLLVILLPLAVQSYFIRLKSPYRDYFRRDLMTFEFEHPKLQNIHSLEGRVKSVNELMVQLSALTEPGDHILAYNDIPMVHYLTETKPYLMNTWPNIQGPEVVKYYLTKPQVAKLPKVIVRSLTNTQSSTWGNGQRIPVHNQLHFDGTLEIDKWITEVADYKIFWSNSDFLILTKK